ncbi:type II/IV secretion system protein [Candidatus Gottesmanbacteria bacterium]|nr:type II/IV secretion system protein [Candidatus Gottesmanbacteria bacterium]
MPTAQNVADILVAKGLLDAKRSNNIKLEALASNRSVEDLIKEKALVPEVALQEAKAQVLGVPFVSLASRGIAPEVLSLIPESVARRYHVIPFDYNRKMEEISVAMADPLNVEITEFLERKSGKRIKPYLATGSEILSSIEEQYAQNLTAEVSAAIKETAVPEVKTIEAAKLGEIIREAPIAKIVSTMLEFAVRARASDIHIEPQIDKTRIRYRIDGILHEKLVLPKSVHDALISRIKILSDMKIDEKRIPQDGRFNFKLGEEEVDLRISTLPTVHGEKIVIRLLKKTGGLPTINELGLRGAAQKNLESNILRPHGIILVTGPTGSGKTTTLYAILSRLNTDRVNIVTLEDPVEYELPGVNQVQINPAAGLTFATGLRSFLRQDPNIILVGEIRDAETAGLAIQAALTGHLVFSTLHTNNAVTAIPRLLDMGAEPFLVTSSLNCLLAQRIVRKVCSSCKEMLTPSPEIINDIKNNLGKLATSEQIILYRGKGCRQCSNTGYFGRIGIFEVLPVSERIARMIVEHASSNDLEKQAVSEGMITLKQDGYLKVVEGITTIEEVLRVAQD